MCWPTIGNFFLFPYIALISAFAAQMALLGFIFPPFISPGMCHLMVEDYSRACQRERGKKKEEEEKSPEKPLRHDRDLNPQTQSPEPSLLSILNPRTRSPEPSVLSIRPRRPASRQKT